MIHPCRGALKGEHTLRFSPRQPLEKQKKPVN
jgi:hypothetical protein